MQQCIEGERSAFRALYDRYAKAMYNTALRILDQPADAEDVLQESFADAFRQLKLFENRSTFGAWLKQIVVHKCLAQLKKRRVDWVDIEKVPEQAEETVADENEVWYTVDIIRNALPDLPDGYRSVLSLYLFEGYDQEEIAEILGVAPSTVRTQYIRAKQKLLQLLKKREVYER